MGPCLSVPETKEEISQAQTQAGRPISNTHASSTQPKKFSQTYDVKKRPHDYLPPPGSATYNSPSTMREVSAIGLSTDGVPPNVRDNSPHQLNDTRSPDEAEVKMHTTDILTHQPKPRRPRTEEEEGEEKSEEPSLMEQEEERITEAHFPTQLPFSKFKEMLEERMNSLLDEKEQLQGEWEKQCSVPSHTDEIYKGIASNQKRRVAGETLQIDVPESKIEESGLQQLGGVPSSGVPSTSNATFLESPAVSVRQDISDTELSQVRALGAGQSGKIILAMWFNTEVAIKIYHGSDLQASNIREREASNLSTLKHPCVVHLYGQTSIKTRPAIVLEYMIGGSLKSQLHQLRSINADPRRRVTFKTKLQIALQAASGVAYLHSRNTIHFDLKAENFLCDIRDTTKPIVKVADVGLSRSQVHTFVTGNMRGTLPWMAPEMLPRINTDDEKVTKRSERVDRKVDVYSFGVVLYEIWTLGSDPYSGLCAADALFGILSGTLRITIPRDCPPEWANLMQDCWRTNPVIRPTIDMVANKLEALLRRQR